MQQNAGADIVTVSMAVPTAHNVGMIGSHLLGCVSERHGWHGGSRGLGPVAFAGVLWVYRQLQLSRTFRGGSALPDPIGDAAQLRACQANAAKLKSIAGQGLRPLLWDCTCRLCALGAYPKELGEA